MTTREDLVLSAAPFPGVQPTDQVRTYSDSAVILMEAADSGSAAVTLKSEGKVAHLPASLVVWDAQGKILAPIEVFDPRFTPANS
jgi:hypothetical protein